MMTLERVMWIIQLPSLRLANMNLGIVEERCLRRTARYIKIIGMWPGQNTCYVRAFSTFFYCVLIFALVTQISRIVIYWSIEVLMDQMLYLCVPCFVFIKHSTYFLNYGKFKTLFESVVSDLRAEKTKDEQKIMDRFAHRTILLSKIYLANAYFVGLSFLFVPFVPFAMDVIMPLNESRPRVHMYQAYYFLKNEDDYYYEIMFYTILSLVIAVFTFIGTDTMLIYLVQHSCVMLNLAGHRIRFSLEKWALSGDASTVKDRNSMYKRVVYAIQCHQRALTYLADLDGHFRYALLLQMGLIVLTLTISLLQAGSVALSVDTYQFYAYATAQLVHIFFLTAQGQFIVNEHDSIYRKTFQTPWYKADIKTQLLLILVLRQNVDPPQLTAGGLIRLDFDSFSEVVKASVSYFTVLKST